MSEELLSQEIPKFKPDFQRGKISEEQFWESICSELNCQTPEGALWESAFREALSHRKEVYHLAYQLGKSYKVGFLSNTEVAAAKQFNKFHPEYFDVKIFSCYENSIKPESQIYELCLEQLQIKPNQAVFIDDKVENIAGAKNVGMHGIVYGHLTQLVTELKSLGVDI